MERSTKDGALRGKRSGRESKFLTSKNKILHVSNSMNELVMDPNQKRLKQLCNREMLLWHLSGKSRKSLKTKTGFYREIGGTTGLILCCISGRRSTQACC